MPPPRGETPDVASASPPPRSPLSTAVMTGHSWELSPTAVDAVPPFLNELLNPGGASLLKLGWELALGCDLTLGPELLGLTLGWGRTLGLELAGAHSEVAGSPYSYPDVSMYCWHYTLENTV
jgi:hypothetical protein